MRFFKTLVVVSLIIFLPNIVEAAMSSTNYYIYADSLDYGGGLASSTSFNLQDSIGGEVAIGSSTSTSYQVKAGYEGMDSGTLTLSLDSSSIDFGQLAVGAVASQNLVAVIAANSDTGYTFSISGVSGSSLTAVTDGAVDGVGSVEEYGLAVSGSHAAYVTDAAVVNGLVLSSFSAPANDQTTLTFKAIRSSNTTVQTYSQDIVVTLAAN